MGVGACTGIQQPGRHHRASVSSQRKAAGCTREREMMRLGAVILVLLPAALGAQTQVEAVLDQVRSGVKPDEAMGYMRTVYSTDRWYTFPKFQETADYLKAQMIAAGLQKVELLSAP